MLDYIDTLNLERWAPLIFILCAGVFAIWVIYKSIRSLFR